MLRVLVSRVRGLFHRRDDRLNDEIQAHLDLLTEQHLNRDLTLIEARLAARREFGGVEAMKDAYRDQRGFPLIESLAQDVRFTVRAMRRSPGFALTAILTLAIGIGANTALFGVLNAVLLRPLPYRDPEALVLIGTSSLPLTQSYAFQAWRERARSVSDLAGFNGPRSATLVAGSEPQQVDAAAVTPNFFSALGTVPALGRNFSESDSAPGAPAVALLTHDLWTRRFAEDRGIVGRVVTMSGESLVVIGVTGPEFRFPAAGARPAGGLPEDTQPDVIRLAGAGVALNVIGRLAPGATPASAASELLAIFKQAAEGRLRRAYLDTVTAEVVPLQRALVGDVRQRLLLLLGVVGFVLLVACSNVANLLLARVAARQRELAVRAALGAGRSRLARLVLTESLLLALIGASGALLLMLWTRGAIGTILADRVSHVALIPVDWRVLGFNAGVATGTGIFCGLASLKAATRVDLTAVFNAGGSGSTAITSRIALRRTLLAAQIAITLVLVVGAALLLQTFWNLTVKEDGFDARRVLAVPVSRGGYGPARPDRNALVAFFSDLEQRMARVPGVVSVAAVSDVPLAGSMMGMGGIALEGDPVPPVERSSTPVAAVSPGYFRTMDIAMRSGRDFEARDRVDGQRVAIVNEAFVRRYAADRSIIGRRIRFDKSFLTIVGIAADVPDRSLREPPQPAIFTPLSQMAAGPFGWARLTLVIRTRADDPLSMAPAIRREMWAVDRNLVIDPMTSMTERIAASIRSERQNALLFALFAAVALALAVIGVYGVAAYSVAQRVKEIGVRMALGANRRDVVGLVLAQVLKPALVGVGLGLAGAYALTRLIGSMLYGVTPLDPSTFIGTATAMIAVALAATYLPARRASRQDPMIALRCD